MTSNIPIVEAIKLDDQLAETGYTIGWVLRMIQENNPKFVDALGDSKVKKVSLSVA